MATPRLRHLPALALALGVLASSATARADGVEAAKASATQREQAQARFVKGRDLYTQSRFADALEEFRASHEIVASPNARLYSARCLRELGRVAEAYAELGRAEAEARDQVKDDARYARTAESAAEERRALAAKLAFLTVRVDNADATTTVKVSGEELPRAAWGDPLPITPGTREVVVETKGRAPLAQSVTATAGETKPLTIDASSAAPTGAAGTDRAPAPTDGTPADGEEGRRTLRTASFVAGGVGLAGIATFAIFGALSNGKFQNLQTACKGGPCPPSRQSDIDSGRSEQTIANIGLAIGLIGVAAGVTLFLVSAPKKSPAPTTGLLVGPTGIGGTF